MSEIAVGFSTAQTLTDPILSLEPLLEAPA
jgi:hypothetical protein